MKTHLSVNVNAIAHLRNRRDLPWPSVTKIAGLCLEAGASGITVHPRPDERHIRRTDVFEIEAMLRERYPSAEYNIEGYPSGEFLDLVEKAMPEQVTFVPDTREQSTSDHGWDIAANRDVLIPAVARMKALGIRVSLFIDEDATVPALARDVGADRVELYTAPYGAAFDETSIALHLGNMGTTAQAALALGLGVNAGHDLTLSNLPGIKAAIPALAEVSIGHAITSDALIMGFPAAVKAYNAALGN